MSLSSTVSNSMPSRTDMIAMPWSPIVPETRIAVARPRAAIESDAPAGHDADAGGGDEDLVALAAIDDLGVAGDQRHAGLVAGPRIEATIRARSASGSPPRG